MEYSKCEKCSCEYNYLWYSSIWDEIVNGKYNYLCQDCFTKMCENQNILIRWDSVIITRKFTKG